MPRSTYYYRSKAQAVGLNDELLVELPVYGYRRFTHELRRRGYDVNLKRVARVMKAHGLGMNRRPRFIQTTDGDHDLPIFPNLYCNVIPALPLQVWLADITYRHGLLFPGSQPGRLTS